MESESLMTVEQVAKFLNVAPLTVYRLLQAGKLRGSKVGRVWRIRRSDVEVFLDRSRATEEDAGVGHP